MKDTQGEPVDGDARWPFLGEPPTRRPRPVTQVPAVRGKRVVLSRPDGFVYDVRAVTEVYTDGTGNALIDVCTEEAYYEWALTGRAAPTRTYPAYLVWVE